MLLLAQNIKDSAAPPGHAGPLLLAESEVLRRGAATQFELRGPAMTRDDALAQYLGLEVTLGAIPLPAEDISLEISVGADGTVEKRRGRKLVRLGALGGAAPRLQLWCAEKDSPIGKRLHHNALQFRDVDGQTLLEAAPLTFDIAAGPAL